MSIRPVKRLSKSKPTLEGAGVHLRRAFGFGKISDFDPFLLLDDFRNDIPEDYLAGFPWHPHRGHLRACGRGRAWRQYGQQRVHWCWRCSVDDSGKRNHSSGDAEGRRRRTNARVSTLGESSGSFEDDDAALSGGESGGYSVGD